MFGDAALFSKTAVDGWTSDEQPYVLYELDHYARVPDHDIGEKGQHKGDG